MRSWLLVFFLLLLPLQLSWAAASAYCQHENTSSVQHVGHHVHKHTKVLAGSDGLATVGAGAVENDCGVCHVNCSLALQTPSETLSLRTAPVWMNATSSVRPPHYQDLPERPQWASLA